MSKGYLRTVEAMRNRLMASEWELGLRPIALQLCAAAGRGGQPGADSAGG